MGGSYERNLREPRENIILSRKSQLKSFEEGYIAKIEEYTKEITEDDFYENTQIQDAVLRRLEIIGGSSDILALRFCCPCVGGYRHSSKTRSRKCWKFEYPYARRIIWRITWLIPSTNPLLILPSK